LPEPEQLEKWIAEAFEKEPNRAGIATVAGMIFRANDNKREAQRYFSRATQIDRLNDYATVQLAELYEEAERPKDALATIELYTRAGGRHPGLLWQATQIAFRNEMPQEFLSYYTAYTALQPSYPMLDAQRIGMLCRTEQWDEAIKGLDALDVALESLGRDRLFVRALCQAELGDESWSATVEQALQHTEGEMEGLVGTIFDPSEMLWNRLKTHAQFEQFLFERNLVPNEYFVSGEVNDDEEDLPVRNLYRCTLTQPLSSDIPTYAGWVQISPEESAYHAWWFVVADSPEEATALALAAQARCYPFPAESVECELLDIYSCKQPQVIVQARRFSPENETSE
jgi:tetratricopeptide (TPR) repeat protein